MSNRRMTFHDMVNFEPASDISLKFSQEERALTGHELVIHNPSLPSPLVLDRWTLGTVMYEGLRLKTLQVRGRFNDGEDTAPFDVFHEIGGRLGGACGITVGGSVLWFPVENMLARMTGTSLLRYIEHELSHQEFETPVEPVEQPSQKYELRFSVDAPIGANRAEVIEASMDQLYLSVNEFVQYNLLSVTLNGEEVT